MPHLSRAIASLACAPVLLLGAAPVAQATIAPHLRVVTHDGDGTMPGMDHGTTPEMDHGTMPGMDHGTTPETDHGTTPETAHSSHGAGEGSVARPRGVVLGGFVGVNTGVMLAAAIVRRRTSAQREQRRARRAPAATA